MIENKQKIIDEVRQKYLSNQFSMKNMNPSKTKLGPCFQLNGEWSGSSWSPTFPIFDDYIKNFELLGETYGHLSWLPLAIPKIEFDDIDEFKNIWEREKIEIRRVLPSEDEPWNEEDHPLGENSSWKRVEFAGLHVTSNATIDFNIHDLYVNGKLQVPQYSNESGFRQGRNAQGTFTKKLFKHRFFSKLIVQIMDTFPIAQINNIMILEPIKDVYPHREQTWPWKCPTEFRINIHDENTEPTIYVSNIQTGVTKYIDLPDDTNSFCWSNGTHLYGIDYHNKPLYHVAVNAVWNYKKVATLLEKSVKKYERILEKN